jgi:hypothetical protein
MTRLTLPAILYLLLLVNAGPGQTQADTKSLPPNALNLLKTSKDSDELERTALALIHSQDKSNIGEVVGFLKEQEFRNRLDAESALFAVTSRIWKVLAALGKLPPEQAQEALLGLAADKGFMSEHVRQAGLIEALGGIKKPSDEVMRFFQSQLPRNHIWVATALTKSQAPEACQLLLKMFGSPDYPAAEKRSWLMYALLYERYEPAIVGIYEGLLKLDIKDAELRDRIVATLFDYRPFDWYGPNAGQRPRPPLLKDAATPSLVHLRKLTDLAENFQVTQQSKQAVARARMEIDETLRVRQKKP